MDTWPNNTIRKNILRSARVLSIFTKTLNRVFSMRCLAMLLCVGPLNVIADSNVIVHNRSDSALWIFIERPEIIYRNVKTKIKAGKTWAWCGGGTMSSISVVPFNNSLSLDNFEKNVSKELGNPKKY